MTGRAGEIRARTDAATPGPWCWEGTGEKDNSWAVGVAVWKDESPVRGCVNDEEAERWNDETGEGEQVTIVEGIAESIRDLGPLADAEFIAHAREDVPWLLAERDRLREAVEAALRELGVPGDGYPAPVANAHVLLSAVLHPEGDTE